MRSDRDFEEYRERENVRQFRIVDGPDEVHERVIARAAYEDVEESELDRIPTF